MHDLNLKPAQPFGLSSPAKITIIYFIIGALWIFFSDIILATLVSDTESIKWISIYKGWLFVIVTGALLFLLIKKAVSHRDELEKELVKSELKYRSIVETFNEIVWTFDPEGRITFINGASRRLFGYSPEEMTGNLFLQYVAPEYRDRDMEYFKERISSGSDISDYATMIIDKQGNLKDVIVNAALTKTDDGNVSAVLGTILDVTEKKKNEEALIASEEKYRKLVESSHGLVWALDKDYTVTFVNQDSAETLGYEPSELIGNRVTSKVPPEIAGKVASLMADSIKNKRSRIQFESIMTHKNGNPVYFLVNQALQYDSNGNFKGAISKSLDITERKKIEEQVRISEEKYRNIVETANEGIWITDKDYKTTFVNRTLAMMLGYEVRDMLGRQLYEFLEVNDIVDTRSRLLMNDGGKSSLHEFRFLKKSGEAIWTLMNVTPMFDNDGNFEGTLAMLTDVTEWKRSQDALKESENKYRTLLDTSPSSIRLIGLTGELLYVNRQTAVLHGYDNISEMIGVSVFELLKGHNKTISKNVLQSIIDNGFASGEICFARKDGSEFPAEYYSSLYSDEMGRPIGIISIVNDISGKKKAERDVLESRERLSAILDSAMDAIITTDGNRKIVLFNKSAEKLFNCPESAAMGKDVNIFIPERLHEAHNHHLMNFSEAHDMMKLMNTSLDVIARTFDGKEIPVETSVSKTEIGGMNYFTVILRDIADRIKYETDLKDTNSKLHLLASHLQNVREEERLLISRDIHDQVGQELTALKMDMVMLAKEIEKSDAPPDGEKVITELRAMAELTDKSIKWIRNLSTELRPDVLDRLGLFEAIEWHCKEFERRSGIKRSVTMNGSDSELSKENSIVFFRILQESLTNVLRHSGASEVEVIMSVSEESLTLVVKDNGKGITDEQLLGSSSLGLIGMKERAYMLGGTVDVCRAGEKGTSVTASIPGIKNPVYD